MESRDIVLFNEINTICRNFIGLDNKSKLNKFLDFFEQLYPNWIKMYNSRDEYTYGDISEEVEKMLISKVPESYTVDNFKETREFDSRKINNELEKMARILHLSNRVAHGIEYRMGTYITNYLLTEATKGNDNAAKLLKSATSYNGDDEVRVNDKFMGDFIKRFPFNIKFNDEMKESLISYLEVDMQREKIENRRREIRNRRQAVAEDVLDQQRSLMNDEDFEDDFLESYLKRLRLKIRLENAEELNDRDRRKYEDLCADRVGLTNFISEETLKQIEDEYLEASELYEEAEDLKMQRDDYVEKIENSLGLDVSNEFQALSRFRKSHNLKPEDIVAFINMNFTEAKKAYDNCMDIKNRGVFNIHEYIVKNRMKYISYGVSKDSRNRSEDAEKNVFWIDLPGYSQFAVHFLPEVIRNDLLRVPEAIPDYETLLSADGRREQVALLSKKSPDFRIFEKKYATDYSIDREMGYDVMTKYPNYKKEQFRKMYGILSLDLGDDIKNREDWLKKMGKDYDSLTEAQRKVLNIKVSEDKERRKAVRHQLGVMMGLSKEVLKNIYDFEELQYTQEFKTKAKGLLDAKSRNDLKIKMTFDNLLGRNKTVQTRNGYNQGNRDSSFRRNNHGYRKTQSYNEATSGKDDSEFGD